LKLYWASAKIINPFVLTFIDHSTELNKTRERNEEALLKLDIPSRLISPFGFVHPAPNGKPIRVHQEIGMFPILFLHFRI